MPLENSGSLTHESGQGSRDVDAITGTLPLRYRRLSAFVAVLLAVVGAFFGYSLTQSLQRYHTGVERDSRNLVLTLEQFLLSEVEAADRVLRHVTETYPRLSVSGRLDQARFHQYLLDQARHLPEGVSLRAADMQGRLAYGTDIDPTHPIDVHDREWFKQGMRGQARTVYFPVLSRVTNEWVLPLSQPLRGPDGRIDGVVAIVIPVKRVQAVFSSLDVGPHGVVTLFDDQRYVLIRYPDPKGPGSAVGIQLRTPQFLSHWNQGERYASYRAVSVVDGQYRTYTYRQVGAFPLHVIVGLAPSDYLGPWYWEVGTTLTIFLLLVAISAAAIYSLRRIDLARAQAFERLAIQSDALQETIRSLADASEKNQTLLHKTSDGLHIVNADGYLVEASDSFFRMHGHTREEFSGAHVSDWCKEWTRAELVEKVRSFMASTVPVVFETFHQRKDGSRFPVEITGQGILLAGHRLLHVSARDVTERRHTEQALRLAETAFKNAQEAIIVADGNATILDVNPAFTEVTGFSRSEAIGQNPRILQSGRQGKAFYADMWKDLLEGGRWQGEFWNRRKNGELYLQRAKITAVRSADGKIDRYVAIASDVTQLRETQDRIEHLAFYDPLTHLANRTLLADRLAHAILQTDRRGDLLAVCYLDLDGFKPINDTWGHDVGDQLLIEVAKRLQACVRAGDTVARLGGDEFVILLGDARDLHEVEQALRRVLSAISEPYRLSAGEASLSASMGVTIYPIDGQDADTLIRHADQAMYTAKQLGKNRYHLFDPESARRAKVYNEIVSRVDRGLQAGEFVLYYQPKVDMRRNRVVGVEALIRWNHPERGLLLPGEFLPAVENSDLALLLGEWVVRTALKQADEWRHAGVDLPISVNISGRHLQQDNFVTQLARMLSEFSEVPPGNLELEILETTAMDDVRAVSKLIADCAALGVSFALDDFGTGYSSLTYFRRLPTRVLKIDQSFVRDMLDDLDDQAIVEGVISLAQTFQREVIAEGVETIEHGIPLMQFGCDLAQGYAIARPMPGSEIPGWIRQWTSPPEWQMMAMVRWPKEDFPLLMADIQHRRWIDRVTAMVAGRLTEEGAIPMDPHQCKFGQWLDQAGARYHQRPEFSTVQALHLKLHTLGDELVRLSRQDPQRGRERLEELYALRDELKTLLDQLKIEVGLERGLA